MICLLMSWLRCLFGECVGLRKPICGAARPGRLHSSKETPPSACLDVLALAVQPDAACVLTLLHKFKIYDAVRLHHPFTPPAHHTQRPCPAAVGKVCCSTGGTLYSEKNINGATQTLGDYDPEKCMSEHDYTRYMRHALVIR